VAVLNKLHLEQKPKEVHVAVVIAAPEGIEHLRKTIPNNCHLWVASLDERLNEKNYIIPGLGDAGDLAFGDKL
jgi:uracil phosphoribosyltransferase